MSTPPPKSQTAAVAVALTISITLVTASAAISYLAYFCRKKTKSNSNEVSQKKIEDLEASLKAALRKCAAERQGRIRAQQDLREAMRRTNCDNLDSSSYPMAPIGVVRSCFSTRNGTPRQPLLVPLARASLILDPSQVPQASLEGLEEYSHCWIIYVFHLNTDLEKLWRHPSQSKFKAKVRVPRLKGERVGVFATRSPHRLCPIGLTVAKVEAVNGHNVLLSGVDLVDGTPILDIKPYLPYCDNIQGATVPEWVKMDDMLAIASVDFCNGFSSSLADCWSLMGKKSLYASPEELQLLIKQVLSWDIRSVSQRNRPHKPPSKTESAVGGDADVKYMSTVDSSHEDEAFQNGNEIDSSFNDVIYHLILDGFDVSYRIDSNTNVLVENISIASPLQNDVKLI